MSFYVTPTDSPLADFAAYDAMVCADDARREAIENRARELAEDRQTLADEIFPNCVRGDDYEQVSLQLADVFIAARKVGLVPDSLRNRVADELRSIATKQIDQEWRS